MALFCFGPPEIMCSSWCRGMSWIQRLKQKGLTALDGIKPGLSKAMEDAGTYAARIKQNRLNKDGEVQVKERQVDPGEYVLIGWKVAQLVLASFVDKDWIYCSHRLTHYESSEAGVDAYFEVRDEVTCSVEYIQVVHAKLLVGADGIWSAVRKIMVGDMPRFLHLVDWNAYVPNPGGKLFGGHSEHEIVYQSDEYGKTSTFIFDSGKGYSTWILRKLDLSGDLSKTLKRSRGGQSVPGSKLRALEQVKGLHGWDDIRRAIEATDESYIFERPIMDSLPLEKWSDSHRRVLLIGDAAHAQYVGPGQGARTAFEDAHQLAILLEEAFSSSNSDNVALAVEKFEELRIPRMVKMQQFAAEVTGVAAFIPEWVSKLAPEEKQKRWMEYEQWIHAYPDKMQADPESIYWK